MAPRRRFLSLISFAALALLSACGKVSAEREVPKSVEDRFALKVGARTVQVQVAITPAESAQGLMFRREMGADEGMIFLANWPHRMSFWMRNTYLPLDIGYFDAEGVLREVYPMYPHDERRVVARGRVQFALEMHQGWYSRAGVKIGDQLDLAALAAAVKARGFNPADFGLR